MNLKRFNFTRFMSSAKRVNRAKPITKISGHLAVVLILSMVALNKTYGGLTSWCFQNAKRPIFKPLYRIVKF